MFSFTGQRSTGPVFLIGTSSADDDGEKCGSSESNGHAPMMLASGELNDPRSRHYNEAAAASVRAPSRRPRACVRRRCSSLRAPKPSSLSRDSCGTAHRHDAPLSRCHSVEPDAGSQLYGDEREESVSCASQLNKKETAEESARVLPVDRVLVSHSHGARWAEKFSSTGI